MMIPRLTIAGFSFAAGWIGGCLVPKPHDPKPPKPIIQPAKETRLVESPLRPKPTVAERYDAWLAEAWALHTALTEKESALSMGAELRAQRLSNIDRLVTVPVDVEAERQAAGLRRELQTTEGEYIETVGMRANIEAAIGAMKH